MIIVSLVLFSIANSANAGDDDITQCAKGVVKTAQQDRGQLKKRPSIDPTSCLDLDAGSCTLFALTEEANYATNLNNDPSSNGFNHYKVAQNCQKYPKLAEDLCPRSCALCCKTLDYSCNDITNCENITRAMCQTAAFYDALLRSCPHTCGLCRRPGAGNRCPNTLKECDILARLGGCNDARIKRMCQSSCHSLDCLNQTTSAPSPALPPCRDERVNCGSRPDLCVGPYRAVYANQCKLTCGLCNRG